MRTLVLSIGNTSVSGGVFAEGKRVAPFRIPLRDGAGRSVSVRHWIPPVRGKIERIALCSVVPKLTGPLVREVRRRFGVTPRVLTADNVSTLKIGYRNPRVLGVDRIAAALGARELVGARNVIVVDCGTATTVTALRRDGVILGGAIFPGLALWSQMLAQRTAQLPEVPLRRPRAALGRSPREALQSGIFHGHVGAVRELVGRIRRESFGRGKAIVIATGGNLKWLSGERLFSRGIPDLVLIGLKRFSKMEEPPRL
ncbi:MAG: type III pantothenate kinase [Opitutaceae bacterium]